MKKDKMPKSVKKKLDAIATKIVRTSVLRPDDESIHDLVMHGDWGDELDRYIQRYMNKFEDPDEGADAIDDYLMKKMKEHARSITNHIRKWKP